MADQLWQRAQCDLVVQIPGGPADPFVWEHSWRVAQLAEAIASSPEVGHRPVDRRALAAAAWYHDAGWVLQVRAGKLEPREALLRPTSDLLRELAADWVADQLRNIVPPGSLELAARAVRHCNDRQTDLLEAQLLAEADNLDQIGPQAICLMHRKQQAEGKTLFDLIDTWQRQQEYRYWQARLKESFRFPSVRRVAEQRWRALQHFMTDLRAVVRGEDLGPARPTPAPKRSREARRR